MIRRLCFDMDVEETPADSYVEAPVDCAGVHTARTIAAMKVKASRHPSARLPLEVAPPDLGRDGPGVTRGHPGPGGP